jgi:allantoate deiminase
VTAANRKRDSEIVGVVALADRLLSEYRTCLNGAGVSGERIAERLSALSQIGLTEQNGSCRIGFSPEEKKAKELFASWMAAAGLTVRTDAVGNVFGRLAGSDQSHHTVLCGSHLDTVPNGGHFDGALGVVLALEVVDAWKETGFCPQQSFEIVAFSDEEGTRFNAGLTGSRALVGAISEDEVRTHTDHNNCSFQEVLQQIGLAAERLPQARRDLSDVAAYVEVHIEQGIELECDNLPVGIVNGIAGLCGLEIKLTGTAGHAGTTPMGRRRDALVAACKIVSEVSQLPCQVSDTAVATVGQMNVYPNGSNVIPNEVKLSVDVRDITETSLNTLVSLITETARRIARQSNIDIELQRVSSSRPTPVSARLQTLQAQTLIELGIRPTMVTSGAGHDAMILGQHVPMAMFFVRSRKGISHNPREWSSLNDCVIAANALSGFLKKLLSSSVLESKEG